MFSSNEDTDEDDEDNEDDEEDLTDVTLLSDALPLTASDEG